MKEEPLITVLMPVYNAESYLNESINSILQQTFSKFEFLIIDDCSTDKSAEIILSYKDSRIRLIQNDINLKVARTLNRGLELARGKYIVRMDADDISLKNRLQIQYDFMESHPNVGVCGSNIKFMGSEEIWKYPVDADEVKCRLLFYWCLVHPTVIMRRELFVNNGLFYNPDFVSEDYDLWVRAMKLMDIVNLNEVVLLKRVHEEQVTVKALSRLEESAMKTQAELLSLIDITPTQEESYFHYKLGMEIHPNFGNRELPAIPNYYQMAVEWLEKIKKQNEAYRIFPQITLTTIIDEYLYGLNTIINRISILKKISLQRPIYIWGSGKKGQADLNLMKLYDIPIQGIIDNSPAKWGAIIENTNVLSPNVLGNTSDGKPFIIISSMYFKQISEQLESLGFSPNNDFLQKGLEF